MPRLLVCSTEKLLWLQVPRSPLCQHRPKRIVMSSRSVNSQGVESKSFGRNQSADEATVSPIQRYILYADPQGRFRGCTSGLSALLDYPQRELDQKDVFSLFSLKEKSNLDQQELLRTSVIEAASTDEGYSATLCAHTKSGNIVPVQFSAAILRDSDHKPMALIAVITAAPK